MVLCVVLFSTMLTFVAVGVSAFLVALLTFFSGFGLGTLLMPCFAVFFPIETAVALTGIVHLLNNVLKFGLTAKQVHWPIALRFGVPAVIAAIPGALLLKSMADRKPLVSYSLFRSTHDISALNLVLAILIIGFAIWELNPRTSKIQIDSKWMPLGGVLSGFFGGLSGHQGAFRSAFLIRSGMSKEMFIITGIVCAMSVDIVRLGVYGAGSNNIWQALAREGGTAPLLITAVGAAFLGSWVGLRFIPKVTMSGIQQTVAVMLIAFGAALALGLI